MLRVSRALASATDRVQLPESELLPDQPRSVPSVVFSICRHCTMRCPHCYLAAGTRASPRDLGQDGCTRVLDRLAEGGVRDVIFSGGEPLIREDLGELVAHAQKLGMASHLSSNGVLLKRPLAVRLRQQGLRSVVVAVDGPRELHDTYRRSPGAFDRAVAGLRIASQVGLRTGLRMTLTSKNSSHMEALFDLAVNERIHRFVLMHLVPAQRKHIALRASATRQILLRLFTRIMKSLDAEPYISVVTECSASDGPLMLQWLAENHGRAAARRAAEYLQSAEANAPPTLCVDSRGRLFPGPFWRTEQLADMTRQPLSEGLAHPLISTLLERDRHLQGRCGACTFKTLCGGGHRGRSQLTSGKLWGADPDCVLTGEEIARPLPY